jgi:hypothetical protein
MPILPCLPTQIFDGENMASATADSTYDKDVITLRGVAYKQLFQLAWTLCHATSAPRMPAAEMEIGMAHRPGGNMENAGR